MLSGGQNNEGIGNLRGLNEIIITDSALWINLVRSTLAPGWELLACTRHLGKYTATYAEHRTTTMGNKSSK
jgi:hypothetical protein